MPWFMQLPVYINVFDALEGSCAKPFTASCAAAKTDVVLMCRSCVNLSSGSEAGSSALLGLTAAAAW
jgi:hypothetical protein